MIETWWRDMGGRLRTALAGRMPDAARSRSIVMQDAVACAMLGPSMARRGDAAQAAVESDCAGCDHLDACWEAVGCGGNIGRPGCRNARAFEQFMARV